MKTARFPLYAKILLWFFLNLLVLGAIFFAIASEHFRVGPELFAIGGAGERVRILADLVSDELDRQPRLEWDRELERFRTRFGIEFLIYRNNGDQLAGTRTSLPTEVFQKLTERPLRPGPPSRDGFEDGRPDRREAPFRRDEPVPREGEFRDGRPEGPRGGRPPFLVKTSDPKRYWIGVHMRAPQGPPELRRGPATLVLVSRDLRAGGLLMDFTPWLWAGAGALLFSVLFWIPLVRHITKPIRAMQHATAQIAEGNFETKVDERRRDELGVLGSSINRMAARLAGFVTGQKRFTGDIAHELCSPLARMQMALGILEERADEKAKPYVNDVREEVQHMSSLVNEVLSFSKASLGTSVRVQPVNLRELVERAIKREASDSSEIHNEVPADVLVLADLELIARGIANLLRNAVRYAGDAGPIVVTSDASEDIVRLVVRDNGPGVPESELPKLFDPFYRVDTSRARETGGVGLGLSIVKTCVEACGGTVACRNRQPRGFEVVMNLRSGAQSSSSARPSP
jgi:two-component system, OmpR family, sensor histidine kinase CpxA